MTDWTRKAAESSQWHICSSSAEYATLVKRPFESDGCYGLEEDGHPSDNDVHKMLFEMPQRVHFFP